MHREVLPPAPPSTDRFPLVLVTTVLIAGALALGIAQVTRWSDRVRRVEHQTELLQYRLEACEGPGGALWPAEIAWGEP